MTEKDAIKIIKEEKSWESDNRKIDAFIIAIDSLEEIQKYREIGTLEECRESMILMKKNAARKFPIIDGTHIPWEVIEIHEHQALINHGQTLQRLAERGGLSWGEASAVLDDRRFCEPRILLECKKWCGQYVRYDIVGFESYGISRGA